VGLRKKSFPKVFKTATVILNWGAIHLYISQWLRLFFPVQEGGTQFELLITNSTKERQHASSENSRQRWSGCGFGGGNAIGVCFP
jgi:hypothetical protein